MGVFLEGYPSQYRRNRPFAKSRSREQAEWLGEMAFSALQGDLRSDPEGCPGLANDLIGRSPFQSLQVLGEVVGGEGQDIGLQAVRIVVVEDLDCGVLDRAVHSSGLVVGPRVIGPGQRCSMPFFMQTRSKMWGPRKRRLGPPRFLGRSAKAVPMSVSTAWILYGPPRHC